MNYRHAFHAGNFADVMKHALLARILTHLNAKPTPWRYLDTHAGIGVYDLAADEAERTGEWREGIGRLDAATLDQRQAELLAPYLDCVAALRQRGSALYPGSPEIARLMARQDDRLSLAELHPADARRLGKTFADDQRIKVFEEDGWIVLKAGTPPVERRGLVLIDPPFEQPTEFERIGAALRTAHRRWRTGIYAIWHPIKDLKAIGWFKDDLASAGIPKILALDLVIGDPIKTEGLAGSGLIIVNPPWTLESEAQVLLSLFARLFGRSQQAGFRIEWLAGE